MDPKPKDLNNTAKNGLARFVETGLTVVGLRNDGIVEIRFKKDQYEVDVKDQMEIHNAFFKLTNGGKERYHIMVIPGLYGGITKEARNKETFTNLAFKDQKSISVIVRSLSNRILGKFYYNIKKDKPSYPFMFFANEELCLKWIRENK